jgi:hypothetical protein
MIENKNKLQKAEDFIGWKSPDGKLEVIGIIEKSKHTKFKVTCTECSKDPELFPDGYFISTKSQLDRGQKPCGCSNKPEWFDWQYLVLAYRAGEEKGFVVHGFAEEFKGAKTKLDVECLKDGYRWQLSYNNMKSGRGCPKCANRPKVDEQEALQKCIDICEEMNYDVVGFPDGYKNCYTRFEYNCKIHGKQKVSYDNFVNGGRRCRGCAKSGYSTSKQGTFYVYQWTKGGHSFIKFGITNQKEIARIKQQKRETEYNYKKVWSATFEDGSIPLHIENYIKNSGIEIGIMSKEEFPRGFTETVKTYDLYLLESMIIHSINSYI